MSSPRMRMAKLDEASLRRLQNIEEAMGATILALEPIYPVAQLTPDQLEVLQKLEKELGVVLIAYQTD